MAVQPKSGKTYKTF